MEELMSIEVRCGEIQNTEGRKFTVLAHVCEEFKTQVDLVSITFGLASIFEGKPSDAKTSFQKEAVALAQAAAAKLDRDDGCDDVIDDSEHF